MRITEKNLYELQNRLAREMYERYPSLMAEYFKPIPTCFSSYEELLKAEKSIAKHYDKLFEEKDFDR